jgi:predicted amidohydrolase
MPGYKTVPLQYEEITAAAVQVSPIAARSRDDLKKNLEHVLYLCDAAQQWPIGRKHLVVFPEFIFSGFNQTWTRAEWEQMAIRVPGPETDALCAKARQHDCYIVIQAHTLEKDWPGHFFNTAIVIGPKEGVIHTHWKAFAGFPGVSMEYSTCVNDVLDQFIEKYGWEAVWPVARTPIGNIAAYVCSEGMIPETARMFAFNGAEILCRSIGGAGMGLRGGKYMVQFRADCISSMCFGVYANGSGGETLAGVHLDHPSVNFGGGGSMVVGMQGEVLAMATDSREEIVSANLAIGNLRRIHATPNIRTEIYAPVYEQHPGQYPPNMFAKYLPKDFNDAGKWVAKFKRW